MNPVRTSLRYPQVTLVIAAMLFITGLYALVTMPRREDPKITIRVGIVSAVYPGATAAEVEDQVTRKIEERLFRYAKTTVADAGSRSAHDLASNMLSPTAGSSHLRIDAP